MSLSGVLIFFTFILRPDDIISTVALAVLSIVALVYSSDAFVDEALPLSRKLKMSSGTMGKLILGTGAVLDEIAVVLNASFRHLGEISVGTIMGSNISTMVAVLPFLPLLFLGRKVSMKSGPVLIVVSSMIAIPLAFLQLMPHILFVPLFILIFLVYLLKRGTENVGTPAKGGNYSFIAIILSIILLLISSNSLVIYTDHLTELSGLSEFSIGFIVTGVAGSLPELIMFVISLRKVDRDAAMGVLVGSTIYKGAFLLAMAMLITNLDFASAGGSILFMAFLSFILLTLSLVKMKKYYAPLIFGAITILGLILL